MPSASQVSKLRTSTQPDRRKMTQARQTTSGKKAAVDDGNDQTASELSSQEEDINNIQEIELSLEHTPRSVNAMAAKSVNQSNIVASNKLEKSRRILVEDATSPKTPCDDMSCSRSDLQEEDFVCVPLSNLNKDAVTFNTKDQLLKRSLMMSELSNHQATDRLNDKVEGIRSMVMYAAKLEKNDSSMPGSMVHALREEGSSQEGDGAGASESQISMEFPQAKEEKAEAAKKLAAVGKTESMLSQSVANKKEM